MRRAVPLLIGFAPVGLVVGIVAAGKGLSLLEATLMSGLVYAGAAQLVALDLWQDPVSPLAAALAALAVNLRMAPMGAVLAPWLDRLRGWRVWGTLLTLVDHSFALSVAEMRSGGRDAGFLLGTGFCIWLQWVGTTMLGHTLADVVRLPPGHPLFFAGLGAFVGMLVPLWRGARDLVPWGVAAAVAVAANRAGLGAPWPVLAGALSGAAAGAAMEAAPGPRAPGGHR
ncbi:AzlC family ABC transporter permease [Roseomonas sp. NAR14]|uniref:AzlC family ABC transporter permease n=1 Tax=Roseomonas acroporae TaxID=2937791 RepID=A0A9X1YB05_9PROT|nr:AzlC family ABC transporter permease [Roseomonas acroporae]MCK8786128.1 AzlC family ABC transporter permease [Roseomonas acroporae]